MQNKRGKRGISLIVLVITIIVMIILASSIIISLNNTGIIESSNEAAFKESARNYQDMLNIYLADKYLENNINISSVFLDENSTPTIKQALNMDNKYAKKFAVDEGELIYIGKNKNEIKWCKDLGIKTGSVAKYELVYQTGGWEYKTNSDGTITLTKYIGTDTEIVVPTRYRKSSSDEYLVVYGVGADKMKVTGITENIFKETIDLDWFNPEAVVGKTKCSNITNIKITDGIKYIGAGAFVDSTINKITIPESLKYLGANAFSDCHITEVEYNAINCKTEKMYGTMYPTFAGNKISKITIGEKVKVIPQCLFGVDSSTDTVSEITIPESVEEIQTYAFYNMSSLKTINLSKTLKCIGKNAFTGTKISTINFDGNFEDFRNIYIVSGNTQLTTLTPNYSENIKMYTTEVDGINWTYSIKDGYIENLYTTDSDIVGTLNIPSMIDSKKVRSIGYNRATQVIANNTSKANVTDIIINEGIETINDFAFFNLTALTCNLKLPNTIKNIRQAAFYKSGITGALVIPNSVETIGDFAFSGNSSGVGSPSYTSLVLGSGIKKIGAWAFQYASKATNELILPEGIEEIGDGAFNQCYSFSNTEFTIPATVKYLGGNLGVIENTGYSSHLLYNFATRCTTYKVASKSNYFKSVDGIIYNKSGTRLVAVPYSKTFTNNTFYIPEGVTQLDEMCFTRNTNVKTIVLPNSFKVKEENPPANVLNYSKDINVAQYLYSGIVSIQVKATNPTYKSIDGLLYTKDGKTLVAIPVAYSGKLTIPDGTEIISSYVTMSTKRNITEIYIPKSVKYIGYNSAKTFNGFNIPITIDSQNTAYEVDSSGKIVEKK